MTAWVHTLKEDSSFQCGKISVAVCMMSGGKKKRDVFTRNFEFRILEPAGGTSLGTNEVAGIILLPCSPA